MVDWLFVALFKYRLVVFERGDLVFDAPWPLAVVLLAGAAVAVPATVIYARTHGRLERRDRVILAGLRLGAIAVLVFCLARPMLVIATVVPQQNFLGILVDDSRSMRIPDQSGAPRGNYVGAQFSPDGSELLSGLSERFKLRFFRFAEHIERVDDVGALGYAGRRTDLGQALHSARRELAGVPLAGLVVLTDGADNSGTPLTETLLQLKAAGVPVHTVGLGSERFEKDIALRRVAPPRAVLRGSSVSVDVTVTQSGFGRETVRLTVEDAGRILSSQDVRLPAGDEPVTVPVHFTAEESGPRVFRFRIEPHEDEIVTENNTLEALIVVEDDRRKILYFEGEPRFEVKFLRRAIAEDENLHVVVLQRTAENKFYRLDVDDPDELEGGFPDTREELFAYDGLILGSVEASFFTLDQLRMIGEFASQRGGALLTLGGRHAFVEGGYAGTPLAEALPVVLQQDAANEHRFFAEVKVELTPFGRSHPVTQLAASADESEARWKELPPLSTLNPLGEVKPGASTLLLGRTEDATDSYVVLAYQRYGRGKVVAFPVQDSWQWQMHADVPLDDLTHETFWRQLLRWLVSDVTDHVRALTSADRTERGIPVTVTAEVTDSGYVRVNGAEVFATVTAPSGDVRRVPMEWTVERDGEYRTEFAPEEDGLYEISVQAEQEGTSFGQARSFVQVGDMHAEFFDAEMQAGLLQRVAEETGGHFYTPATVGSLPEDVSFTESGTTVHEERDLWDMPVLLILLLGLFGAEWGYRRTRGLA
jgi:uncharacterized membrane protein